MKRVRESQTELLVRNDSQLTEEGSTSRGKRRANHPDGKTWTRYSISVWSDIKKSPEEIQLGHPAIFPLQLAQRLIECFTTSDDSVIFDPFVGIGTTAIAADRMNKTGIGIELSPKFCEIAEKRLSQRDLFTFFPLHSDLAQRLSDQAGFIYDDVIIWDRRHEYNNMRPLGYPFVFRINKAHEYILIFKKPSA